MSDGGTSGRMSRLVRPISCAALLAAVLGACDGSPRRAEIDPQTLDPPARETLRRLLGPWQGELGATGLQVLFRFEPEADGRVVGWMDSPGEGLRNMAATAVRLESNTVQLEFAVVGATYEGTLQADSRRLEGELVNRLGGRFTLAMEPAEPGAMGYLVPRLGEAGESILDYTYTRPPNVGDGWETGQVNAASEQVLTELIGGILDESYPGIESLLVVKNGRLLVEEYFYGFHRDSLHQMRSVTKTIASVLTGVALQQGFLESVETPVDSFYPDLADEQGWDERKRGMTLEHLLTMTTGLEGDDWEDDFAGSQSMRASEDWIRHVSARRVTRRPGRQFAYSGSSLILLAGVLERTSGMTVPDLADEHLFGPLGIEQVEWQVSPAGTPHLGSGLHLKPRDLAKIGQLFLNGGMWEGRRIVSEEWVAQSTQRPLSFWGPRRWYGYLWWSRDIGTGLFSSIPTYFASGLGGQKMFVVPDRGMVVVITSGNYDTTDSQVTDQEHQLLETLIEVGE